LWAEVAQNIKAEKWKEANAAKDLIEKAQRARAKEMKDNNEVYSGKLFVHNPNAKHYGLNWEYKRIAKLIQNAKEADK